MADIKLPKIALGAWAWGNDGTFGSGIDAAELEPIFDAAMAAGLNLWDTAYAYGMGTSEKVLAGFMEGLPRGSYLVSDKLTPQCVDASAADPVAAMHDMQLGLMGLDRFDIYWVHNTAQAPKWTRALAEFFEGRDDAPMIGVSNHNLAEVARAHGVGAAQVPVAWAIAKGTLPIVGVTKERHVADAAAAAAVELTDAEVAELEQLADTLGIDTIRFWEKAMD